MAPWGAARSRGNSFSLYPIAWLLLHASEHHTRPQPPEHSSLVMHPLQRPGDLGMTVHPSSRSCARASSSGSSVVKQKAQALLLVLLTARAGETSTSDPADKS
eukprot:1936538-Rhodomonas_salina.1